ncbi:MAG: alpha/beta hydrolase [Coleofasciculus chthonoplastes F3-SA18-01]
MTTSVLERNHINILGEGTQTIIFAHGFGSDQTAWRHQVAAFAPNYRIVLICQITSLRVS